MRAGKQRQGMVPNVISCKALISASEKSKQSEGAILPPGGRSPKVSACNSKGVGGLSPKALNVVYCSIV